MNHLINYIVKNPFIHAKWLNTLSYLENAGARKISSCEHKTKVDLIQLKHAAEEHRHAFYLKKQILKISENSCPNYESNYLLAPYSTQQYLNRLDIETCRYLKNQFNISGNELKYAAYLFVTYAIEVRADKLYPIYQDILTKNKQKVMVKSIILEEEGHLEEMISQLQKFHQDWKKYVLKILEIENGLFNSWIKAIENELNYEDVN